MGFLGYQKNEIREYNDKRCCGLWFIIIGVVILISTIFGGEQKIQPAIFTIGFAIGFYISVINKKVVEKLSYGKSSKFQNNMAVFSIVVLFPLMFTLSGPYFQTQNWRMIWLGSFLAVGLHFIPFYFVHGISMIAIAILCSANALIGMFFPTIPFIVLAFIDGFIKIGFGVYLLFLSKPTKTVVKL
ncbi:DUF6609 family protein [Anaerorhabdus sp.]|uniref:DUF6609 family protein n=1 Tax=Anaerorhabdus sp. TaxID=1872524 RepID=UPI002FCC80B5